MKSTLLTAAAVFSSTYAATVTLETTKCLNPSIPLEQFTIEMNLSGPVARDINSVCGLQILSASPDVDINSIRCQAFKDVVGEHPGSAIFSYTNPALIATNPVQIKAVGCTYPAPKARRQINETVSSTNLLGSQSATSASLPRVTTVTLVESVSASGRLNQTTTTLVSASASGNATTTSSASLTVTPSASQTSDVPSESSSAAAAGKMGVGMGVLGAAVLAAFV